MCTIDNSVEKTAWWYKILHTYFLRTFVPSTNCIAVQNSTYVFFTHVCTIDSYVKKLHSGTKIYIHIFYKHLYHRQPCIKLHSGTKLYVHNFTNILYQLTFVWSLLRSIHTFRSFAAVCGFHFFLASAKLITFLLLCVKTNDHDVDE